jgi:5'(3')-deoxyribonucleotidase
MSKKTIAVDVDDVLAANVPAFIAFSNERWGTSLTVEDYSEHWGDLWKVDQEEWARRAVEFHDSGVVSTLEVIPRADAVLKTLAMAYDLVIVTSRRTQINKETGEWINRYFPGIFSDVHFAGMWDEVTEASSRATKAALCKQIGADYLIDDHLKHCQAAAEVGIESLLFGDYPWNQANDLPPNIKRVSDWPAISEYFRDRS